MQKWGKKLKSKKKVKDTRSAAATWDLFKGTVLRTESPGMRLVWTRYRRSYSLLTKKLQDIFLPIYVWFKFKFSQKKKFYRITVNCQFHLKAHCAQSNLRSTLLSIHTKEVTMVLFSNKFCLLNIMSKETFCDKLNVVVGIFE